MAAYKPTMSYRLIYIFTIHDAQHEGYWKIGKTNFDSVNSYKQLPPNCAELNCAAAVLRQRVLHMPFLLRNASGIARLLVFRPALCPVKKLPPSRFTP